ncbi:MAG: ABC transporter ATP-binding protein [Desulfococcaceae bacterium]|jgi:putative ABC transport system ATP-binding protein|nr:ABC transporter ATP-binding protein [Desulfococcaceae bacterium]
MEQTNTDIAEPAVFCLKNVVKTRVKGNNRFELNIAEFIIRKGEFIAIVGTSGCGKSTLLDMLGLALRPDKAEVFSIYSHHTGREYRIAKAEESELADIRKSHIGYVLQTGGLLPFLSVQDNILLPRRVNGMDTSEKHAKEIAEKLNIADQLDKKPQFLSGGQRQRVAIARALAHRPPIVLADEPTAAVDEITAGEIMKEFKALTKEMGVTLLMVTHDVRLVKNAAGRMFGFELPERENPFHILSNCYEKIPETHPAGEGEE